MSTIILILGLVVFGAHFLVYLFKKTGIPDVLLLMVAGIFAGPLFNVITPQHFGAVGEVMTTIALIVILFESGVNLKLRTLLDSLGQTTLITLVTWVFTAGIAALVMHTFAGLSWPMSLMTGAILGGTSSAVVIPLVSGLKMSDKPGTVLNLESGITDVLCIVGAVGIGRAIEDGGAVSNSTIGVNILLSFGGALILGVVAGWLWSLLMGRIRLVPNTIFTTVAYVFVIYGLAESLRISGAIAALSFGVTIANTRQLRLHVGKHVLEVGDVSEIDRVVFAEAVFLLKTFFFIYLGLSLQFQSIHSVLLALMIVGPVYVGRFFIIRAFGSRSYTRRDASIMTAMVPKGLAAAVLATLPAQFGAPPAEADIVLYTVYMVVLISIVLTATLVVLMEKTPVRLFYQAAFHTFATQEAQVSTTEPTAERAAEPPAESAIAPGAESSAEPTENPQN